MVYFLLFFSDFFFSHSGDFGEIIFGNIFYIFFFDVTTKYLETFVECGESFFIQKIQTFQIQSLFFLRNMEILNNRFDNILLFLFRIRVPSKYFSNHMRKL